MATSEKPSTSGVCVGVVKNDGIILLVRFTGLFNEDNYQNIVITKYPVIDGSTSLQEGNTKRIAIPASSYGNDDYYFSFTASSLPDYYIDENEMYTMYFSAQAANGKYYSVSEGNPAQFWISTPTMETYYYNGHGLYMGNLEQEFSSDNFDAIVVSEGEVDNESEMFSSPYYECTDFTDTREAYIESDFFEPGITYYVYKRTKFGLHRLYGEVVFEEQKPEIIIGACTLKYTYESMKEIWSIDGRVTGTVDEYIDISLDDWEQFCTDINNLKTSSGLSAVSFTSGESLSAVMWNEVMTAFYEFAEFYGYSFDIDAYTVSRGDVVSKQLIDDVNDNILYILGQVTTST